MIKKCEYCGKTFETNNKYKKYCNRNCKEKHKKSRIRKGVRRDDVEYTKVCPICGKTFVTKIVNKEYCSEECSNKHSYQRNKEYIKKYCKEYIKHYVYTKVCKTCGKTFNSKTNANYCPECQENKLYTHVCKKCGKSFITSDNSVICSECRNLILEEKIPLLYFNECIECGKTFVTTHRNKKFCDNKCKKRYQARLYRLNSYDTYLEVQRKYRQKRRKTDIAYKLRNITSHNIRRCLTNRTDKTMSTLKYINYTIPQLKQHIETLFTENMSWDNYGSIWHIDHIKPLASYNFYKQDGSIDLDAIMEANSLDNLQPMFVEDNLSKSSWYEGKLYKKGLVVSAE